MTTRKFVQDEIARGAAPSIASNQTIRELVEFDDADATPATVVAAVAIRVVRIDFKRAEGYTHECGLRSFFSWEDFNNRVRRAALTAPADGSCHKCDARITWADGAEWYFRLDLTAQHAVMARPASDEAYGSLAFFRGDFAAPDGEDPVPYLEQFDEMYPGVRERATALLNGYDLGRP